MLVELPKVDFSFEDERGCLVQLVHDGWKQINVIRSKKSSIRGGHYHKINNEAFYIISGRLNLTLQLNAKKEDYVFSAGDMFVIKKGLIHSFEFTEDTILVSMYDYGVELENGKKDIYTL